jgi:sulfonate transport system permease protein
VIRQIPLYAWIPLIILWFGIGEQSKLVIIAKSVFIPVFINTFQGVRGVSNDYVEVANVLELSRSKLIRKVIFPSALPSIFTGLRLGAGASWMAVVAAEMLGGLTGLGFGLMQARDFLRSDKLIALMAVIGLVGFLCDRLIRQIEATSLHWRKGFKGK